jgi:glycosyltransferase involved in cell wall biosynthesis/GT2 family glycosyltransferase
VSAPRVSIVLPSFNGSAHLDEAVGSVAAQTFKDWELVLVDDGSTDATAGAMDAWAGRDPRVRAVHLASNRGLPAALNQGFRHARGELFTWTSDDNRYLPGAIERMVEKLDADPDVSLVYADHVRFDEHGLERRAYVPSTRLLPLRNVVGCCFLYRREVHEEIGGFDEGLFLAEDYDFWLRASTRFRFEAIPEVLYRYRDHAGSLTARRSVDAHVAAVRAVERFVPALDPLERVHVRLRRAQELFARGQARAARELALLALIEAPEVALRREHRRVLASSAIGHRLARASRKLLRPDRERAIRLILPDYLGGVTTWCVNLAAARPAGGASVEWYQLEDGDPRRAHAVPDPPQGVDHFARVAHAWPDENLFAVLRRLRRARSRRHRGVIVANEFFGLAYAARWGREEHLVQILHQDAPMYYQLAEAFEPFVDLFVTVSAHIRDELIRRLPGRAADIRYVRSGVPTGGPARARAGGALRLVFSGRLEPVKGVLDLPAIDRQVRARGARVHWTIIGDGPLAAELRAGFAPEAQVDFAGALAYDAARERLARHDLFVLPSHAEGLSLALLEAMAAGVVPVVSDLASGTREVVESGSTGLLARPGRPEEFADAIVRLAEHPELLERMSAAAAARVADRHSLAAFGAAFYELVGDLAQRPIPYRPRYARGPSRLDRVWLPNLAVRLVRAASRRRAGAAR